MGHTLIKKNLIHKLYIWSVKLRRCGRGRIKINWRVLIARSASATTGRSSKPRETPTRLWQSAVEGVFGSAFFSGIQPSTALASTVRGVFGSAFFSGIQPSAALASIVD